MSNEANKQRSFPLIGPFLIGLVNVLIGFFGLFLLGDPFYQLLSVFLIIPGILILLYAFKQFKDRREGQLTIKHDERSERNRLRAAELGFRFFFVSLLILILLHAMNVINEIIFVAVTGPIIAMGVTLYYVGYYWFEQRG